MSSKKTYYINGEWIANEDATISHEDGGFQRGYGLFETIRFEKRKIFRPEKHFERLSLGLSNIKITLNYNFSKILSLLNEIINKNDIDDGLIRLTVTMGDINNDPWNFDNKKNIYISIRTLPTQIKNPVKIKFYSENNFPIVRFLPQVKSLNYLGNMLAKRQAKEDGAFEPVFYNSNNYITECAVRNIFFIKNNILLTPSKKLGVLPGIMRETVLETAKDLGYKISTHNIKYNDVDQMDEAFITSTGIGVLPCFWGEWQSNYSICSKIKNAILIKFFN